MSKEKELNFDTKVKVKNLCGWDLYFNNIESNGETKIVANGEKLLTFGEIQSQVNDGNPLFAGFNQDGNHAKVFIDNADVREELGFDKQVVLDHEKAEKIISYERVGQFKNAIEKHVVTDAEKSFIMNKARKMKLNDYERIKFLEDHTGLSYDQ